MSEVTVGMVGAATGEAFFGDSGTYMLDSDVLPGVLHTFHSFAAAADEAFIARIYGGIHFRYDQDAGERHHAPRINQAR